MTDDRDFDRVTRAWLDLMPDEAPDRTIDAVLQAVEVTPQVRRPLGPARWRHPLMNRFSLAAAAVLVAVGVGGALLITGNRDPVDPVVASSPSPSIPLTSPSPTPAAIPPELEGTWLSGARRDFPVLGDADTTYLNVTSGSTGSIVVGGRSGTFSNERFLSLASIAGDNVRFEAVADQACERGQVGNYEWSLSPGGTVLELTSVSDECGPRSKAVAGTWYREACVIQNTWCVGDLEARDYYSWNFTIALRDGLWKPRFGELTYSVPGGWTNTSDYGAGYYLEPTDWYHQFLDAAGGKDTGERLESKGIYVLARPAAVIEYSACDGGIDPAIGTTVEDLVAYLIQHPGIDTSEPEPIHLNGLEGTVIDVALSDSWTGGCPDMGGPGAVLFTAVDGASSRGEYEWGVPQGMRDRYILLDAGGGRPVLIDIAAPAADFEEFLPAAMEVVQTFEFN